MTQPEDAHDEVLRYAAARVGRTLKDKWTLDQLLGVGGMAAVYAATHRNQKRVAIKMLHPELSFNAAVRTRFLREGYVANTVQHSGAVIVDDDDVGEDGCAFLVMELLDGETLEGRWQRKGKRLPPGEVLAIMDRVLETLVAAHSRGIVHRDLKPENLFLTRAAQVKVLDFGIARVRELGGASKTQTGSLMGTPTFMPPEQARGRWEEVDGQSDLWAVGATMFTLLTGEFVHPATTVNEALVLAVTQPARSIGSLRPELPSALISFVDRALAYDKGQRWPDAASMQAGLREAYAALEADWDERTALAQAAASLPRSTLAPTGATSGTLLATSSSQPPQTRIALPRRWLLAIAGGSAILLVAVLLLLGGSGDQTSSVHVGEPTVASISSDTVGSVPGISSIAASPPPLTIDDLPMAEPRASALTPPQMAPSRTPAPTASRAPVVSAQPRPKPSMPKDPFAGRD
jgi:serine/threonine-protein kinase